MNMSVDRDKVNEFESAKKSKEYLMSYTELQGKTITPDSFYQRINQERLEREKREAEERRQFELQQIEQALKEEEQQRKREAAERREQQIESGMAFLVEKFDDGKFKVTNFNGAKNRIDQWLRLANHAEIPIEEHDILLQTLERLYASASKRDQKQWQNFNKGVWIHIIRWIGGAKAEEVFGKLIKQQ